MRLLRSQRGQAKATPALLLAGATVLAGTLWALYSGTSTVTPTHTATRSCIPFDHVPGATQTLRCLSVYLPGKALQIIGSPGIAVDGKGQPVGEYVAMEVQVEGPGNPDVLAPLRALGFAVDWGTCTSRPTPLSPSCQIAFVRVLDPLYPSGCACGPGCTVTDPSRGLVGVTGIRDRTFEPGTWAGSPPTCVPKPCREFAGTPSMPGACQ